MDDLAARLQRADRLALISQQIGFTLWQIQELEGVAALHYVMVAKATRGMGLDAGQELARKAQQKTFGATLHDIAKAGILPQDLQGRFWALLSERNWLVHKSRADSRDAVHHDAGARRIIDRLEAMAEEALQLVRAVRILGEEYVKANGVSQEQIDRATAGILREWHMGPKSK